MKEQPVPHPTTSIGEMVVKRVDQGGKPFEFFPPPENVPPDARSIGQIIYTSLGDKP